MSVNGGGITAGIGNNLNLPGLSVGVRRPSGCGQSMWKSTANQSKGLANHSARPPSSCSQSSALSSQSSTSSTGNDDGESKTVVVEGLGECEVVRSASRMSQQGQRPSLLQRAFGGSRRPSMTQKSDCGDLEEAKSTPSSRRASKESAQKQAPVMSIKSMPAKVGEGRAPRNMITTYGTIGQRKQSLFGNSPGSRRPSQLPGQSTYQTQIQSFAKLQDDDETSSKSSNSSQIDEMRDQLEDLESKIENIEQAVSNQFGQLEVMLKPRSGKAIAPTWARQIENLVCFAVDKALATNPSQKLFVPGAERVQQERRLSSQSGQSEFDQQIQAVLGSAKSPPRLSPEFIGPENDGQAAPTEESTASIKAHLTESLEDEIKAVGLHGLPEVARSRTSSTGEVEDQIIQEVYGEGERQSPVVAA